MNHSVLRSLAVFAVLSTGLAIGCGGPKSRHADKNAVVGTEKAGSFKVVACTDGTKESFTPEEEKNGLLKAGCSTLPQLIANKDTEIVDPKDPKKTCKIKAGTVLKVEGVNSDSQEKEEIKILSRQKIEGCDLKNAVVTVADFEHKAAPQPSRENPTERPKVKTESRVALVCADGVRELFTNEEVEKAKHLVRCTNTAREKATADTEIVDAEDETKTCELPKGTVLKIESEPKALTGGKTQVKILARQYIKGCDIKDAILRTSDFELLEKEPETQPQAQRLADAQAPSSPETTQKPPQPAAPETQSAAPAGQTQAVTPAAAPQPAPVPQVAAPAAAQPQVAPPARQPVAPGAASSTTPVRR